MLCFVADGLGTNDKVFHNERCLLPSAASGLDVTVALKLTCAIHALCLVRKPVVLADDELWSNLVRFSHLCEGARFRERLQAAIELAVESKFHFVKVAVRPRAEIAEARRQQAVIFESYDCAEFFTSSFIATLWRYGHSNPESGRIVYFSDEEDEGAALVALRAAFSKAFGNGYPTPLLSRWKHYGPALAYMTCGVLLYGFLHEVIRILSHDKVASGPGAAASGQGAGAGGQNAEIDVAAREHEERLEQVHAQENKVRMEKFCAFMQRANSANFRVLSLCINPLSRCVDGLLLRSTRLQRARMGLSAEDDLPQLKRKLRDEFLFMVSGGFGEQLTRCYAQLLTSTPAQLARSRGIDASEAAALLPLLVAICSDMMKRFGFKFHGFPWFCWACAGDDGLDLEKWHKLRRQALALNTLTTHTYTPSAQALVRCLKLHFASGEGDGKQLGELAGQGASCEICMIGSWATNRLRLSLLLAISATTELDISPALNGSVTH